MGHNHRLLAIEAKREVLIADTEVYRMMLLRNFADLNPHIEFGVRAIRFVKSVRAQITALTAIVAVLTLRRPSVTVTWLRRGWLIWYAIKNFRQSSRSMPSKRNGY